MSLLARHVPPATRLARSGLAAVCVLTLGLGDALALAAESPKPSAVPSAAPSAAPAKAPAGAPAA